MKFPVLNWMELQECAVQHGVAVFVFAGIDCLHIKPQRM